MADAGGVFGECCGLFCMGVLQQFFNTRSWGTNWTCLDSCCLCKCCWDDGEFVPEDQPKYPSNAHKTEAAAAGGAQSGDETAAPPTYKAAEPMSAAKPAEAEAVATPAAAPPPFVESASEDAAAPKSNVSNS